MVVLYLHGFASSPQSSKATFFAERFAAAGVKFLCPDLNQPAFSTLTVSRMLQQVEKRISLLPPGEIVLMGSSLGGFVAVEAAARQVGEARHPISRLILLAPAVELEWDRRSDRLDFGFYEDAARYHPASRQLSLPMLIFQGRQDESVSPPVVERFAHRQSAATLHLLDDAHRLKNSLEFMWTETVRFLNLTGG